MSGDRIGYQYVVLRCVPRVDREEFVNVGVVLYSQRADFLDVSRWSTSTGSMRWRRASTCLPSTAPSRRSWRCARAVTSAGAPGQASLTDRFGFLAAPRSTVVQPGPVHGGLTSDPAAELTALVSRLVVTPTTGDVGMA